MDHQKYAPVMVGILIAALPFLLGACQRTGSGSPHPHQKVTGATIEGSVSGGPLPVAHLQFSLPRLDA